MCSWKLLTPWSIYRKFTVFYFTVTVYLEGLFLDDSTVPADNPRMSTLFLPKASGEKRNKRGVNTHENNNSDSSQNNLNTLKKYNSCSTIYIDDSTVSQPNLKSAIRLVSSAIHFHIKLRTGDRSQEIFDEKMYPISVSLIFTI